MANQIKAPINYPVIAGGKIVAGGSVLFGQPNVKPDEDNPSTLKAVYLDAALTQPAQNPQGLSSDGVFDQSDTGILFGSDNTVYSIVIKGANKKELSYIPEYDLSDANAAATAQDAAAAAASSEANALSFKNLTEALYTDFTNRYFGPFSSDPSVDDLGNPPNEGSIYFNSTSNVFFTWTDGAWVNHFPSNPNGLLVTATGTTTPRTLGDRFADAISVKDFESLVTNGDWTAAFQTAHDFVKSIGGGVIEIPEGDFKIQGVVFESGVQWLGSGVDVTYIKPVDSPVNGLGLFTVTSTAPDSLTGISFSNMTIHGNGTSSNFIPNGDATVAGIDFGTNAADEEINQCYFENLFIRYCTTGLNLYRSVRYAPVTGCRFWNNDLGLNIGNEHPALANNEFRYNEVGMDGIVQDMDITNTRFAYNGIGCQAEISRSAFVNCKFWQNRITGITNLVEYNTFTGCLFRGASTFWESVIGPNTSTCVGVSSRGNRISNSLFYGGNGNAMIEFISNNVQHSMAFNNNTFVVSDGHVFEKTGSGSLSGVSIQDSSFIISSVGDGLGAMVLRVPVGVSGGFSYCKTSGNYFRNESSVIQTHDLIEIDQTNTGGHTFTDNTFHSQSGVCGGIYTYDNSSVTYQNNTFRVFGGGTFLNTINIRSKQSGLIIKDNVGFITENSGASSILIGNTSVTVSHGLDITPTASSFIVNFGGNGGNATKLWVSNVTSSTFDINCDIDPAIGDATVIWNVSAARFI